MKQAEKFKKILVFGHSNIGDACYDVSVVRPLKQAYPKSKIIFVVSKKTSGLGRIIKGIDEVIVFDKYGVDKGLIGYTRFIQKIRRVKFDLAIILRYMQMHYFFNIPVILKNKKSFMRDNSYHVLEKYMMLLKKIGIDAKPQKFEFNFAALELEFVKNTFQKHEVLPESLKVAIMPLSGWLLKCWPLEFWNILIKELLENFKAKIFIIGKTGGGEWEEKFKMEISPEAISLIDKCTMEQSAAFVSHMDLFIGPDTSFLHLASCMDVATIGLYGATDKGFVYPFFHKDNMVVSRAQLECMPCYPGHEGGSCRVKNQPGPCMYDIKPEQVLKKIRQVLKK